MLLPTYVLWRNKKESTYLHSTYVFEIVYINGTDFIGVSTYPN